MSTNVGGGGNNTASVTTNAPLFGTGAPKDKDWDAVEDAVKTTRDQSETLPAVGSFIPGRLNELQFQLFTDVVFT
ncbi:hypothetical protein N7471_006495 [Penicillium samsonianum]|uniref:uncharacterized protein n=1 Tax=Penicillium samsonianum TaxID=1882272 RepID=UPI002547DADF|nr:uncharacterized protein N7471_006495 [Penicillium samsonianum]KAJ6140009.1 hypothetical protein N7471_006495 [Penicillium samsonianum]